MVLSITSDTAIELNKNSIANKLDKFICSFKNLETLTNEDIKQINSDFKKAYDETIVSFSFKPNSKDEFKTAMESLYKRTVCGTKIYNPDYPGLDKFDMSQMPISLDSEFNKFLESKGCSNEKELQVLNKTMFKTAQDLRYAAESRLRQTMFELDKSAAPNAMAASSALVKNVDIETLANYVKSNRYDAMNYEKGFLENYFGNEIDEKTLLIFQNEFNAYMSALNKEKEALDDKPPIEKLIIETKQGDFSKYDEKYGEKYEQALIKNYEE